MVIVRDEKDHDRFLADESEPHVRPMPLDEADVVITDHVESAKTCKKK